MIEMKEMKEVKEVKERKEKRRKEQIKEKLKNKYNIELITKSRMNIKNKE